MAHNGILEILLVEGKKLTNQDQHGKLNTFVKIKLGLELQHSKVDKIGGNNPKWNETFFMNVNGEKTLKIEVLDEDKSAKNTLVGTGEVDLEDCFASGSANFNIILSSKSGKKVGTIILNLKYKEMPLDFVSPAAKTAELQPLNTKNDQEATFSTTGILEILLLEGKDLTKDEMLSQQEYFVSFSLGKKVVQSNFAKIEDNNPSWNQIMTLKWEGEAVLKIEVYNENETMSENLIGLGEFNLDNCIRSGSSNAFINLNSTSGQSSGSVILVLKYAHSFDELKEREEDLEKLRNRETIVNRTEVVDKNTANYIEYLMEGTGQSINFEEIREELNRESLVSGVSVTETVSTTSEFESPNSTISAFNKYLEVKLTNTTQANPQGDISNISQNAFFSTASGNSNIAQKFTASVNRKTASNPFLNRNLSEYSIQNVGLSFGDIAGLSENKKKSPKHIQLKGKQNTRGFVTTGPGLGSRQSLATPSISTSRILLSSASPKLEELEDENDPHPEVDVATERLEKLSRRLEILGFPLMPQELLIASQKKSTSLSVSQANALNDMIQELLDEYEIQEKTAKELQSGVTNFESKNQEISNLRKENRIQEKIIVQLRMEIDDLKQGKKRSSIISERSQHEINQLQKENGNLESTVEQLNFELELLHKEMETLKNRNARILTAFKSRFELNESNLEPVILQLIENYEDKINIKPPTQEISPATPDPYASSGYSEQEKYEPELLKRRLDYTLNELDKVKEERDILKLKFINELEGKPKRDMSDPEIKNLSTRELILKDRTEHQNRNSDLQSLSIEDLRKLIKFIHEVNAIVKAYGICEMDFSQGSTFSESTPKLSRTLAVIREWAKESVSIAEQKRFIAELHELLYIPQQEGSYEQCLAEIANIVESKIRMKRAADIPGDEAQNIIAHFKNLFELHTSNEVVPKMNELFVFWTEVNDGLIKLRESLKTDDRLAAGRVLIHAAERVEQLAQK